MPELTVHVQTIISTRPQESDDTQVTDISVDLRSRVEAFLRQLTLEGATFLSVNYHTVAIPLSAPYAVAGRPILKFYALVRYEHTQPVSDAWQISSPAPGNPAV